MTPTRTAARSDDLEDRQPRWSWRQFWRVAETTAIICFPVLLMTGGFFAGKVLEHDKDIAVMHEKYTTKDETERREVGLKESLDSLKQSINDLRVEIVKVASQGPGK